MDNTDRGGAGITSANNRTRGYDLLTGEQIWEAGGLSKNTIPSPVFANGIVYVASGYDGEILQAIRVTGSKGDITGTKAIVWGRDKDAPYVPSLLTLRYCSLRLEKQQSYSILL